VALEDGNLEADLARVLITIACAGTTDQLMIAWTFAP